MVQCILIVLAATSIEVEAQHLKVRLDPATHEAVVETRMELRGEGTLRLRLTDRARISLIEFDGRAVEGRRTAGKDDAPGGLEVDVPHGPGTLAVQYRAAFAADVAAGERPGQIHNFSVDAHVGEDGVFLSDGSAWHPQPIDEEGHRVLHAMDIEVEAMEGWAVVASGEPAVECASGEACWSWRTPRPVDGMALVGNRHEVAGRGCETACGRVEVVAHLSGRHVEMAPMILDGACRYLELYTPLLGPFPYKRFTVVENFFSSGFAYPGFTVIGSKVLDRGGLILRPGLLDHELVHNWWGNGVYVDPKGGNWCEALTSYCANYYRRVADEGEEAGREYRMATLMKLSADPEGLDDGPLVAFGSADPARGGSNRFVGYDKGAFVLMMLEHGDPYGSEEVDRSRVWAALRRFAGQYLGQRAGWPELEAAFQEEYERPLNRFFQRWVHGHVVPMTPSPGTHAEWASFVSRFITDQPIRIEKGENEKGEWAELDPDFHLYRVLPPDQIVPLIGGTMGKGGCRVAADSDRPEIASFVQQLQGEVNGENLLLIGLEAIREHADLIAPSSDPIVVDARSFTVGGVSYGRGDQAVMHTMQHPELRGRFITVFHSNGEPGWAKLRLIVHYRRDTTVVWENGEVIARRIFEPDRKIYDLRWVPPLP